MPDSQADKTNTSSSRSTTRRPRSKPLLDPTPDDASTQQAPTSDGIPQVDHYAGRVIFGSQFLSKPILLDTWADIVEGYADKAREFKETFQQYMSDKNITRLSSESDFLTATGFGAPQRLMSFYKRNPVSIAVYVAKQGDDLYVSWRAFVESKVSFNRLSAVAGITLLMAILFRYVLGGLGMNLIDYFRYALSYPSSYIPFILSTWFALFVAILLIMGVIGWWRGGDFLTLLRHRIHELHYDDVMSLTAVIHKTIIATADSLGIDTAKLEVREPLFKTRRRPRI